MFRIHIFLEGSGPDPYFWIRIFSESVGSGFLLSIPHFLLQGRVRILTFESSFLLKGPDPYFRIRIFVERSGPAPYFRIRIFSERSGPAPYFRNRVRISKMRIRNIGDFDRKQTHCLDLQTFATVGLQMKGQD